MVVVNMKNIIVIIFLIFFTSCGVRHSIGVEGQCRPKRNSFKLLKIPFRETDRLSFKKIYLAGVNLKSFGIGFYPDGRMVYFIARGNNELTENDVIGKNWNNAEFIGYWRVENDGIKIEYFVCGDFGTYIQEQGKIKGDTIFFYQNSPFPFKKEVYEHHYFLSNLSFD